YAVTILDPATIRFHLEKAIYLAQTGRPGPVWIDIPLDLQSVDVEPTALPGFVPHPSQALPDLAAAVSHTIDLLNASDRPVLFAGNGVRLAHAVPELLEVIEALGIPVLTTWLAHDIVSNDHPLFI